MKKLSDKFLLLIVFLIAFGFRGFQLTSTPVSLSMDEAAIGYNAYSILNTGKDEWGERLPIAFRSVGDYKPPVNIYLTVPSVAIFGLSEIAVRLPVALLGSLSAVFFSLLLKEFGLKRIGYLFGGFWFAVVPWSTHFSRGGFEAVTALFFLILGVYLFVLSKHKKSYLHISLSVASLALSIWSYHSERFFVPLLVLFLVFISWRELKFLLKDYRKLAVVLAIGLTLMLPFIYLFLFTEAISQRAMSTSVFREQDLIRALHNGNYTSLLEKIFNNDLYLIFKHMLGKYINYFDLRFWFIQGMQFTPKEYFDVGLFYVVDVFLILPGIYLLFTRRPDFFKQISLFWFIAGPIAASFTMNEQHPLRALVWLPFFGFASALGFQYVAKRYSKILVVYFFFLIVNIIYFGDIYFRQFTRFYSEYWQYGYEEISKFACDNQNNYNKIYISETAGSMGPLNTGIPYIYTLFYCKFDPAEYQKNKKTGNIQVRRFKLGSDAVEKNTLLVGAQWDMPLEMVKPPLTIIKKIFYPNGILAFIFVDTGD